MGIESLLQQNMQSDGLAGSDRLARNAMYPQSQMDKTQYAIPSQMRVLLAVMSVKVFLWAVLLALLVEL